MRQERDEPTQYAGAEGPARRAAPSATRLRSMLSLAQTASPVAAAGISATVVGAVWWLLALRLTPPAQVGHFVALFGISTLVAEAANLGVGYALIRYFVPAGDLAPALVRTGLLVITVAVAALAALLELGSRLIGIHASMPSAGLVSVMVLALAMGTSWFVATDDLLMATGRRRVLLVRSAAAASGRVLLLLLLYSRGGLDWLSLSASYALPLILAAVAASVIMRREVFGGIAAQPLLRSRQVREYAVYAWHTYLGNLAAAVVPNLLPVVVVWRLGPVAGARFGAAWFIASLLMLVPNAISTVTFAGIARGEHELDQAISQSAWLTVLAELPLAGVVLAVAPAVLPHLGPAYAGVGPQFLAPLLLGVICVGCTSQLYSRARLVRGGLPVVVGGQVVQAVLVLGLAVMVAPDFGLFGVFCAWLAGTAATLILVRIQGTRRLGRVDEEAPGRPSTAVRPARGGGPVPGQRMPGRVVAIGYYGAGNGGDELILCGLVRLLKRVNPAVEITVLSCDPMETARLHGVRALYRPPPSFGWLRAPWPAMCRALWRADLVVVGGGGLLEDIHHFGSVPMHLVPAGLGLLMRRPVIGAGLGVGPLLTPLSRRLVRLVANHMAVISVRDERSAEELRSAGVDPDRIRVGADLAFVYAGETEHRQARGVQRPLGVTIGPSDWLRVDLEGLARGIDEGARRAGAPNVVLFPTGFDGADRAALGALSARLRVPHRIDFRRRTPQE
ncbi:MAG: polysaccharide pyruvyl transferase family protein, partial [Chloroflexi bacterium]|nr:polysaccharide pyruvyl transferase family protein [Chloroflexota bacterium]